MRTRKTSLTINGQTHEFEQSPSSTLLESLRGLGYTDVKNGCESGSCGACAVLVDRLPVNACLTLAVQADGSKVTTLAGLGTAEQPHPLQTAMIESGGVQCGYCTPGVIVAVSALLERNNEPTADEIREALSGNLCRCTGYDQIIEAVQAAKTLAEGRRAVDG